MKNYSLSDFYKYKGWHSLSFPSTQQFPQLRKDWQSKDLKDHNRTEINRNEKIVVTVVTHLDVQ